MSSDDCNPPRCGPGPASACLPEAAYQCSFAVGVQAQVDAARRQVHTLGFRPYRVSLIWQAFNRIRVKWEEVARIDLMPVKVVAMNSASYQKGEGGLYLEGPVQLEEVSPQQVNESQLRGWRDGVNWADKSSEREFFYEIQQYRRCPGDPEPQRYRFALGTAVHHDAVGFQYLFALQPQIVQRGDGGVDQSLNPPTKTRPAMRL